MNFDLMIRIPFMIIDEFFRNNLGLVSIDEDVGIRIGWTCHGEGLVEVGDCFLGAYEGL